MYKKVQEFPSAKPREGGMLLLKIIQLARVLARTTEMGIIVPFSPENHH